VNSGRTNNGPALRYGDKVPTIPGQEMKSPRRTGCRYRRPEAAAFKTETSRSTILNGPRTITIRSSSGGIGPEWIRSSGVIPLRRRSKSANQISRSAVEKWNFLLPTHMKEI
jgi:hypothetical protein